MSSFPQAAAGLVLLAALSACADKAIAPYPVSEPRTIQDAQLGQGDVFDVRVYNEADLTGSYRCGTDGSFSFPLIGKVVCEGKVPEDIEKDIRARLADGYLRSPQVSVLVKDYNSKKVIVFGQVKSPGTFPYVDDMSIIEAVTKAGGFTSMARKNSVRVSRKAADKKKTQKIIVAVEDIGKGKAPNFVLRAGDVVFVPERPF